KTRPRQEAGAPVRTYITGASPSLPRKCRSTLVVAPVGSPVSWTSGRAGLSRAPVKLEKFGREMTSGESGKAVGRSTAKNKPTPTRQRAGSNKVSDPDGRRTPRSLAIRWRSEPEA